MAMQFESIKNGDTRFPLGKLVATSNFIATCDQLFGEGAAVMLAAHCTARHSRGDWGDCDSHDAQMNESAVECGDRIFSTYKLRPTGGVPITVWVVTEHDRSVTTVLLPEDY